MFNKCVLRTFIKYKYIERHWDLVKYIVLFNMIIYIIAFNESFYAKTFLRFLFENENILVGNYEVTLTEEVHY